MRDCMSKPTEISNGLTDAINWHPQVDHQGVQLLY